MTKQIYGPALKLYSGATVLLAGMGQAVYQETHSDLSTRELHVGFRTLDENLPMTFTGPKSKVVEVRDGVFDFHLEHTPQVVFHDLGDNPARRTS